MTFLAKFFFPSKVPEFLHVLFNRLVSNCAATKEQSRGSGE